MIGDTRPLPLVETIANVLHTQFKAEIRYGVRGACEARDKSLVRVDNEVDYFAVYVYAGETTQRFEVWYIRREDVRSVLEFFQNDSVEKGYDYRGPQGLEAYYFLSDDFTQQ